MEVKPMEVKLPIGGALYSNSSQNAASDSFVPRIVSAVVDVQASKNATGQKAFEPNEDDLHDLLRRTVELVSTFDRNLKFEVIKDAGILQIQVIDSSDGMVVRKIPPDEVVKLVTYIKDKLSDNMNVLA
jgi:uncharacterized FlaG/YvyC family protein